jgi:hypothetical protein
MAIASGSIALGEVVYVTSNTSNCTSTTVCGNGANQDLNVNGRLVYNENSLAAGFTTAVAGTPDKPLNAGGARYFSIAFSNSTPDLGLTISPTLGVTGGVYKVFHVFSSTANNVSTNIVLGVTNNDGCTLSFDQTDKFQRSFGQPAPQQWQLLGLLTNNANTSTPTITFYFKSGEVNAGTQNRLLADTFRFLFYEACTDVPAMGVTGPLAANLNTVVVTGVSNAATKITVYQNSGSGMVEVGSKTSDIVGGNNTVTVSGVVKGAQVAATQTLNGQEGCVPTAGSLVGGGANPQVRIALTIRETTNQTATIGAPGNTTSGNLHFLGASTVTGGAPVDAPVIYPSNGWQTVTISRGTELVGNAANAAGTVTAAGGYTANDSVVVQVYAFRTVPANSVLIYSRVGAASSAVTSNNVFGVDWTWNAVPGADGYRLLKSVNQGGFLEGTDVTGTNFFSDLNNAWFAGTTVTPTITQTNPSIQWNPTVGNQNNLPGQWGTLESINFVLEDLTDTGPYNLYIDNIQNGATVFQTFEAAPANTTDYGFRAPSFSGTTSGNILPAPNQAIVSNGAADGGTKSLRLQFQWNGLTASKWLRLTTSGALPASNPFVNLDDPISFRLLLQPVGAPSPVAPPAPSLSINVLNGQPVMNWQGGHRLRTSVDVIGTYTNVPQALTTTNNTFLGPYTNTFTEPVRFFRLVD